MKKRTLRRLTRPGWARWWVAVAWMIGVWVPTALAQHTALPPKQAKPVFQWLAALVMAGLCCAIAFKNAKRSHMG